MIQFHFCKTFNEKIQGQAFGKVIKEKILENSKRNENDLRNKGTISSFGNIFILRTNTPKTRVVIQKEQVEKEQVFFVRDIIFGNNLEHYYGKVVLPQIKNNEWTEKYPLDNKEIDDFIANASRTNNTEKTLQPPPATVTAWLDDYSFHLKYDVFEMDSWVKYALNDSENEGMRDIDVKTFAALLNEIINENSNLFIEEIKQKENIILYEARKFDVGIIYYTTEIKNEKLYLLYNGAHLQKQTDYWSKALKEAQNTEIKFTNNINSIRQHAYKAYPKWTIADFEKWYAIQKNHQLSNLSLTTEQLDFFDDYKFPCYINGQAGSGKSTMLYYLFANTYWYKCYDEIPGDIIFLTENEYLLKETKKSVFDLLSNNPEFNDLNIELRASVDKHFVSFKEFLLGLLPEVDKANFSQDKYLSFSKFKSLYENSYIENYKKEKYSAEESWFTITNYILGYEFGKVITDYSYYNNKDIINKIPKDVFDGIVENVLPFYKKRIEEDGYWDKLTIIKYIKENIEINKKYSVVICDEAQDFCKVELNFILHLSEFFDYDLSNVKHVPVIFAGDPNQTVNPSGFREREMNDILYKEFLEVNYNYDKKKSVYNPRFNFRSAQPIISLANFVQYYRKKKFDIRMVEPQTPKRPQTIEGKNHNYFYSYSEIIGNEELTKNLKNIIKYKRFIVPVDSNEKDDFQKENKFLSLIDDADVKTAIESKGVEYKQVVLFGFGDYYLRNYTNVAEDDEKTEFSRRYFFNKLYVGITRAQNELIIIDSKESEEKFWKKIVTQAEITEEIWNKQLEKIKEEVIIFNTGSVANLIESSPETAIENAKRDKEQGIIDNNASRLKLAGDQFFKFGDKQEGYNCYAISEEILNNFEKAGKYYLDNNKIEKAVTSFFKGKLFGKLHNAPKLKGKSLKADLQISLSGLMLDNTLKPSDIENLYKNRQILHEIVKEISWREDLIDHLIKDTDRERNNEQQRNLIDILEIIAKDTDIELWKVIADKHYKLRYYERAIEIWNSIDMLDTEKYAQAKIEIAINDNDIENETIWLGELVKYKKTNKEKEKIEKRIINKHENYSDKEIQNHYYFLPVYNALLINKPKSDIEKIGEVVEDRFESELENLVDFYLDILKDKRLHKKVAEFVIERIAKTKYKIENNTEKWLEAFNKKYKSISQSLSLAYNEFLKEDLTTISDLPDKIKWIPANRLINIVVENFKRFKKLELNDLGDYNLIVGDNNVGKTSVLEALLFYPDADKTLKEFALAFSEREKSEKYIDENRNMKFKISKNFISDFINNLSEEKQIRFKIKEKRSVWNFEIRNATENDFEDKYGIVFSDFIAFKSELDKKLIEKQILIKDLQPEDIILSPYIPYGKGFDKDLAQVYFEHIDKKKPVRESFIENMKVFIPDIDRISANPETGEINIEEDNPEQIEAAPLHQYGEGANKLFRILLQMTLNAGNKILIDEIDAGIHHSRFPKFWEVILEVAKKENIQLFATTHNVECIQHFKNILQKDDFVNFRDVSRIITLKQSPNNEIIALTRFFEEFEYELDNEFEIRGGDLL